MYTQSTVNHLELITIEFGCLMRRFHNVTCSQIDTKELPQELEAWRHTQVTVRVEALNSLGVASSGQRRKALNLCISKFYALGDYVHTIQMFGMMDSFSTQVVWNLCYQYILYSPDCIG